MMGPGFAEELGRALGCYLMIGAAVILAIGFAIGALVL